MIKNAAIGLLLSTILFMTEPYSSAFDIFLYLSVAVVAFALVCVIEDAWDRHMYAVRHLKRFKKEVNKITLSAPTKAC